MIRTIFELAAADLVPAAEDILRQQGAPFLSGVSGQALACAGDAGEQCREFLRPRGILQEITRLQGAQLIGAAGVLHPAAPLPAILARAEHLALFGVTLGEAIGPRISALFAAGNYPLAAALDAAASLAADRAALAAGRSYAAHVAGLGSPEMVSSNRVGPLAFMPYSPGYCGWEITGQIPLFAALQPAEIGLQLNESCVMEPLKSVSGIILGGPPQMHIFRPEFPFCTQCTSRECASRMASVLTPDDQDGSHD